MAKKERLDNLLVELGFCQTLAEARGRIMAGEVVVDDHRHDKSGTRFLPGANIRVKGVRRDYVSRGGGKLAGALQTLGINVEGKTCMDVGASTGGFTDCLLQKGAKRVYAVDVAYGFLAWSLRQDDRVVNIERTNIKDLTATQAPEPIDFCVGDCSFISLLKVLPPLRPFLAKNAQLLMLIKPQFEGRRDQLEGGVVKSEALRQQIIEQTAEGCRALGFEVLGGCDSQVHGPKGNIEHLVWLCYGAAATLT